MSGASVTAKFSEPMTGHDDASDLQLAGPLGNGVAGDRQVRRLDEHGDAEPQVALAVRRDVHGDREAWPAGGATDSAGTRSPPK